MSRRQLPARSTRGRHPPITPQQEAEDNAFYAQLFGPQALQEPDEPSQEQLKEQQRLKRKELLQKNIRGHTFARAHHYFFDLEQFPKVEGQPSYAIDNDNAFGVTFSQEGKLYKGEPLGAILNRRYFGLPVTGQRHRQQQKTKNPCHEYLFDTEDKKYSMDRGVVTCQKVLAHLAELVSSKRISQFKILTSKDPELVVLSDDDTPLEVKSAILKMSLNQFRAKKEASRPALEYQDQLMFYCSLNQQLHDRVNELRREVTFSMVAVLVKKNSWVHSKAIHDKIDLPACLFVVLRYHLTRVPSVSHDCLINLIAAHRDIFQKVKEDDPMVLIPCQVFSFGNSFLRDVVSKVLNLRVTKINKQMGFYSLKLAWAKLFNMDLELEKPNPFVYDDYKDKMDSFISKARQLRSRVDREEGKEDQQSPQEETINQDALEGSINEEGLINDSQSPVFLFKQQAAVAITDKELLLLALFSYLYQAFHQLLPLFEADPQATHLFASDFFQKHSLSLLQATNSALIGIIDHCLEYFCEVVSRPGPFIELNQSIEWEFRPESGVGLLWKGAKSEGEWVSASEEEPDELSGSEPVKKLKPDI